MVSVELPDGLYKKILLKIENSIYSSVDDYVVSQLMKKFPEDLEYTEEEKKLMNQRLADIGYPVRE
ncbi:MAG: hypothetical protein ACTSRU_10985 [Candidatus Hodarchaeales archaeon]